MHHVIHQWSRNWTLENKIAQKPRKSTPKSNQQRRNGTKHSCSYYCCYWRYCDKHDFMILVTIIAGKLKNVVQTHNKCKQAPNVQDNKRKYDFAKKRGGVFRCCRIWTEILFESNFRKFSQTAAIVAISSQSRAAFHEQCNATHANVQMRWHVTNQTQA